MIFIIYLPAEGTGMGDPTGTVLIIEVKAIIMACRPASCFFLLGEGEEDNGFDYSMEDFHSCLNASIDLRYP